MTEPPADRLPPGPARRYEDALGRYAVGAAAGGAPVDAHLAPAARDLPSRRRLLRARAGTRADRAMARGGRRALRRLCGPRRVARAGRGPDCLARRSHARQRARGGARPPRLGEAAARRRAGWRRHRRASLCGRSRRVRARVALPVGRPCRDRRWAHSGSPDGCWCRRRARRSRPGRRPPPRWRRSTSGASTWPRTACARPVRVRRRSSSSWRGRRAAPSSAAGPRCCASRWSRSPP